MITIIVVMAAIIAIITAIAIVIVGKTITILIASRLARCTRMNILR